MPAEAAGCPRGVVAARVIHKVAPVPPPEFAGSSGVVEVAVRLDARSRVLGVSVYRSTNHLLDDAALRATRRTRFATVRVACRPRPGTFRYIVAFHAPPTPWMGSARRDARR